mgnify:CR=1 FL=1
MTRHICLHGAESTGKSKLAPRLAACLGGVVIPEYGRTYCEANGTDLDAGDLLAIFHGHIAATQLVLAQRPAWVISDTDPLMTQAWAIMLLGRRLPEIDAWSDVADLYLVPRSTCRGARTARGCSAATLRGGSSWTSRSPNSTAAACLGLGSKATATPGWKVRSPRSRRRGSIDSPRMKKPAFGAKAGFCKNAFGAYFFSGGATVMRTRSPELPGKLVNIASTRLGTICVRSLSRDCACAWPSNSR